MTLIYKHIGLNWLTICLLLLVGRQAIGQPLPIFRDETKSHQERIIDLLSKLTIDEKISLLTASSPGIPRLDIDKYYYGNEALHGVVMG